MARTQAEIVAEWWRLERVAATAKADQATLEQEMAEWRGQYFATNGRDSVNVAMVARAIPWAKVAKANGLPAPTETWETIVRAAKVDIPAKVSSLTVRKGTAR